MITTDRFDKLGGQCFGRNEVEEKHFWVDVGRNLTRTKTAAVLTANTSHRPVIDLDLGGRHAGPQFHAQLACLGRHCLRNRAHPADRMTPCALLAIHLAKITTNVDQVLDVFYVSKNNSKVTDPGDLQQMRTVLAGCLEEEVPRAASA